MATWTEGRRNIWRACSGVIRRIRCFFISAATVPRRTLFALFGVRMSFQSSRIHASYRCPPKSRNWGKYPPELLSNLMGDRSPLLDQLIGPVGAFAQPDSMLTQRLQPAKALRVGPDGTGQYLRIPAVILGPCGGESVSKAI